MFELGLLLGDEPAITKTVLKRAKEIKASLNAVSLHKKWATHNNSTQCPRATQCKGIKNLLTLQAPISTYKFSKLISIHFLYDGVERI